MRCCNRWPRPAPCPFSPRTYPSAAPFGSSARKILHPRLIDLGSQCCKITGRMDPLNLDFPRAGWVGYDSTPLFPRAQASRRDSSKLPPALKCGGFPANLSRSPVSGFGFNGRQFYGSVTRDCQSPDVPGGVPIGVGGEPTMQAQKHSLALAVGLLAMPALRASAGRVARVNLHDGYS